MADEQQAAPVAPVEDEIAWRDGKLTFPLTRKIIGEGKELTALTLREPNTGDIAAIGNPVAFNPYPMPGEQRVNFVDDRVVSMISRLSDTPPSTVKQMAPQDYTSLAWLLANFFVPVVFR